MSTLQPHAFDVYCQGSELALPPEGRNLRGDQLVYNDLPTLFSFCFNIILYNMICNNYTNKYVVTVFLLPWLSGYSCHACGRGLGLWYLAVDLVSFPARQKDGLAIEHKTKRNYVVFWTPIRLHVEMWNWIMVVNQFLIDFMLSRATMNTRKRKQENQGFQQKSCTTLCNSSL